MAQRSESRVKISCTLPSEQAIMPAQWHIPVCINLLIPKGEFSFVQTGVWSLANSNL